MKKYEFRTNTYKRRLQKAREDTPPRQSSRSLWNRAGTLDLRAASLWVPQISLSFGRWPPTAFEVQSKSSIKVGLIRRPLYSTTLGLVFRRALGSLPPTTFFPVSFESRKGPAAPKCHVCDRYILHIPQLHITKVIEKCLGTLISPVVLSLQLSTHLSLNSPICVIIPIIYHLPPALVQLVY